MAAGILKYFKPVKSSWSSTSLPEPRGSLSEKVPSKAIELANTEVTKLNEQLHGRGPYLILTPVQRFKIGKRSAEDGVTASVRYFIKKYPELPLKETSVRRNLYQSALKSRKSCTDEDPSGDIQELPCKKFGQQLLIGEQLDAHVQEYVRHARKRGLAINTSVVIAPGCGMVMNQDANQLSDVGAGINLTNEWAKNLLRWMGFVKRKACSKAKINPVQFNNLKEVLLEIKNITAMDEIPYEFILNFDQTALTYVPVMSWTMEEEGAKRVEGVAKRQ